ncbi:MAG: MG2 domain-containing protein, partial [Sediminibacterium sp.]
MRLRLISFLILAGASFTSVAQKMDTAFQKEWMTIDTLILKRDLTKTALDKVNKLYQKAKQQKLPAQTIKALIYQYTLQDRITVTDPNLTFKIIQAEIKNTTDEVQKAVLYSLLAKSYRQYYTNHRYEFYRRANTIKLSKEDIATWSNDDFISTINTNFYRSLEKKELLQKQRLELYNPVIISGNNPRVRPTLYDLLANEALDYYKAGDMYITRPVNIFLIPENALSTIDIYLQSTFTTKDSSDHKWMALQLFQQLLSFHRNELSKEALLDIDMSRIEWIYQQSNFPNKERAYFTALQELTTKYASAPGAAQAWYLLARFESDKASAYQPFADTSNRLGFVKAREIIEKALPLFKEKNNGTVNMQNLLLEISRKELHTQTEKVNIPKKDFRALVKYRNVDTLYGRIIRIDNNKDIRSNFYDEGYWTMVTAIKPYQNFTQSLPKTADYQLHSVEIRLDGLPVGEYAFISSSNPSFSGSPDRLAIQFFYVSNISYIKNKNDFFVLNREDGKPIPDVKVFILKQQYISREKRTIEDTLNRMTDKNGHFSFSPNTYGNYRYLFKTANDKLFFTENDYNVFIDNAEEIDNAGEMISSRAEAFSNTIFFFTDRSIYRPGQPVFFKGIGVTRDYKTKLSKLITAKDSGWVYLKDANSKRIDSSKFALNSYGSFTGKFQIPQNLLTGRFTIETTARFNYASHSFSIEEYKRPTFNVNFETVKGTYRLNDTITITGIAKAYAGNLMDGAKIKYNVIRNMRYQDNWSWRRPMPQGNREISHGELVTDTQGKFTIKFKADADDIMSRAGNPMFDFSIHADVTDISGETRSANTQVTTGYTSLLLALSAPAVTETDSLKKINIAATNLSHEKEPTNVQVTIYPLQAPDRLIRKRYWQQPDQFIFSEKEFIQYFPTDEYANETSYLTWSAGKPLLQGTVN